MKCVVFCSAGAGDPVKASLPFHLGVNGLAENSDEVSFILGGDAAELLISEAADQIQGLGLPSMRELRDKVVAKGLAVYV